MRLPFFMHRFQVSGLNLERFLNLMKQQEIPLLSVRRQDARTLVCQCYSADLAAISALAGEKGWKMEATGPLGLSAVMHRLKNRPGLLIGAVLMLVLMLTLSRFVWRVDVQKAGPYQADIVSFLNESGYHAGIRRTSVDAKALESALTLRYPQIAWFHAYVTNMTLVVEVSQGVPMPEMAGTESGDIVASRGGIIHSIRVFAGTAAVKTGDVVKKGDVLIRGAERARDEQLTGVHAQGVVTARCWDQFSASVPLYEIISTETGRETVSCRIHTPWFDWPKEEMPGYLASNLSITQWPVGGAFFPVFLQTLARREVSMEYIPRDAEEVKKEAAEAALQKLKTALFDDEIIDKWVDYCMIEDDTLAATVTAERLVDIGEFSSP